jgi:hypothetical protein
MSKKWRNYIAARNGGALWYVIDRYYQSFGTGPNSGRMNCKRPGCDQNRRKTRVYDLVKGVTYCHTCRVASDALALLAQAQNISIELAYDVLDSAGQIPVDLTNGIR